MSAISAARERCSAWNEAFFLHGYEATTSWSETTDEFEIVARRSPDYGAPTVTIEIVEQWRDGRDRVATVARSLHDAYLEAGKAHAQIQPGDKGAHRVDVGDLSKPPALAIHLHPFGQPNDYRVAQAAMPVPEQWVNGVEILATKLDLGRL